MTQRKLKRLEITNSTVVTNDALGSTGNSLLSARS